MELRKGTCLDLDTSDCTQSPSADSDLLMFCHVSTVHKGVSIEHARGTRSFHLTTCMRLRPCHDLRLLETVASGTALANALGPRKVDEVEFAIASRAGDA